LNTAIAAAIRPSAAELAVPSVSPIPPSAGVLVIDDEPAVRGTLQAILRQHGCHVWIAAGGAEGLEVYRRNRLQIAFVFLDVHMPEWNGPQTLTALRTVDPEVRCCFISGDTGIYSNEDLQALGAVEVLGKPFRLMEVLEVMDRHARDTRPAVS
jgi:CheY-like chemotaxis protein